MKILVVLLLSFFQVAAFAQDLYLEDYNYTVSDIGRYGHTPESIFRLLDRKFVKMKSICSNRAIVWNRQIERDLGATSAKIFLFYSEKTGESGDKTWWYHVAPMVNDSGTLWVTDAGFPRMIKRPLTQDQWLKKFAGSTNCKELTRDDDHLIPIMFKSRRFPSSTRSGVYDCYYRIAPAPYWTPRTVALNLLGRNERGEPVNFSRERFNANELMKACSQVASRGGFFSGSTEGRCRRFLGL